MKRTTVDKVVEAVLYEGYILYPYRASAVKNRQRFNFGTLFPQAFSDAQQGAEAWTMRCECLVAGARPKLEVKVRFLHPVARQVARLASLRAAWSDGDVRDCEPVASLEVGDDVFHTWQEVVEREVVAACDVTDLNQRPKCESVAFAASEELEPLYRPDGMVAGVIVRGQQSIDVGVVIEAQPLGTELFKLGVTLQNQTPLADGAPVTRESALLQSLASAHIILSATEGEFSSLLDPPAEQADAAATCKNEGCWPVLVGEAGERRLMLASPIILYDYPQIAEESEGDFFDGTEIDEMLALRVMTLTEDEKREMRSVDARARRILERTDGMSPEKLMKLHGTLRDVARAGGTQP
jgi:hypothetical protein